MKAPETRMLPLYSFSKSDLSRARQEALMASTREDHDWKNRCQLLLRYLQAHDLSIMPEALHQRLYMVLTEIAQVLGDNLPDKLSTHQSMFLDIDSLPEDTPSASLLKSSIQSPSATPSLVQVVGNTLLCTHHWSQLESTPEEILARADVNFERVEMVRLKGQLQFRNQLLRQKSQQLQEIKLLYKDNVLESEGYLVEDFQSRESLTLKVKNLEEQLTRREKSLVEKDQQIHKLKLILEKRTLHRTNSDLINPIAQVIAAQRLPEENIDDILTMHSLSRPDGKNIPELPQKIKSVRKPSMSADSCDQAEMTNFESEEGSQFSFRQTEKLGLLRKRIQDLENDLKMKDQVISAINTFIGEEGESILGEKPSLVDLLKRCELKQKYKSYCSLAEQNAYLKKCMDKLTKSEEFWSKLHCREDVTESDHKKCLIF